MSFRDCSQVRRRATRNRKELSQSLEAACYCCCMRFSASIIDDWVSETNPDGTMDEGCTAICPLCGVDAVIAADHPDVTDNYLSDWQRRAFSRSTIAP